MMTMREFEQSLCTGTNTEKSQVETVTIPISRFDELVSAETVICMLQDLCESLDEYDFYKTASVILGRKGAVEHA